MKVLFRRATDVGYDLHLKPVNILGYPLLRSDDRLDVVNDDDKEYVTVDFRHDDCGGQIWYCSMEDFVMVNYSGSGIIEKKYYDDLREKHSVRTEALDVIISDDIVEFLDEDDIVLKDVCIQPFYIIDKEK